MELNLICLLFLLDCGLIDSNDQLLFMFVFPGLINLLAANELKCIFKRKLEKISFTKKLGEKQNPRKLVQVIVLQHHHNMKKETLIVWEFLKMLNSYPMIQQVHFYLCTIFKKKNVST